MTELLYLCMTCLDNDGDAVWASEEPMTTCPTCSGKVKEFGFVRTAADGK